MEKNEKLLVTVVELQEGISLRLCMIESRLRELKQSPFEQMMSEEALCKKLEIHRRTLDRYAEKDKVRKCQIYGRRYYYPSDFIKIQGWK